MKTILKCFLLSLCFIAHAAFGANPNNQGVSMRSTNGAAWGVTTVQSLSGKISTGNVTNGSGSRVAYLSDVTGSTNGAITLTIVTNVADYQSFLATNGFTVTMTNIAQYQAFLATNTYASIVTNIANYLFTLTGIKSNQFTTNTIGQPIHGLVTFGDGMAGDASGATNIQCTNIVLITKAPFSTNYTVRLVDQVLACTGTNQVVTLPNGTNGTTVGTIFCFLESSTTGFGSTIVTNANGVQTVLTAAALSQTITNGQSLTLLWDGANWR